MSQGFPQKGLSRFDAYGPLVSIPKEDQKGTGPDKRASQGLVSIPKEDQKGTGPDKRASQGLEKTAENIIAEDTSF